MDDSSHPARIVCSNLPEELFDKALLKEHFDQFGRVIKIHFRPKNKTWMIQYDTAENAKNAILHGGKYMGQVFDIGWDNRKRRLKRDVDPDWLPDPEVTKELESMGSLGYRIIKRSPSLGSEGIVDSYSPDKDVKSPKANWKSILKTKRIARLSKSPIKKNIDARLSKSLVMKNVVDNARLSKSLVTKNVTDKVNWTIEQLGLLSILKQPALTLDDKFRVLDARDKLIRLRAKKSLDISKANHLVGTCPDMCPEKERIMREIQHQVALYEQDVGGKGMNPALAVKHYSRSSADQEVPLPHELRPVAVLQFTMEYLMHRIMNLCDSPDVNIAEWYHFLWDRTRSIRKDITQQALCCQGSVSLLEQCARFHIHCSAHLVAEDVSVFDHKINTENLTKCLQTLKYMYHDLRIKGENCTNEAEFRAYIILLNLNDGNFMWEVQQLRQEIQKSQEVRFALEVYAALDKNNYVKFYKLVHATTYLNACILLRYFVQVRTKALSILVRCYSPRASYTQFSLAELEQLLAFEDSESVRDFVLSFGLGLNETNTHVVLNRKTFTTSVVPYSLDRAILVVESKRQKTVGEIVCGDSVLPSLFENYTPFNSFNENGIFIISDTMQNLIEESQQKVNESDLIVTKQSVVDSVSKPSDYTKPFWSIKTDTITSTTNIFNQSTPQISIFDAATPNENEFIFKFGNVTSQQSSSIFGGPLFTNTEKPLPQDGIFGSHKESYIPKKSEKQFIFGGIPLSHQPTLFETVSNTQAVTEMPLLKEPGQELLMSLKAEVENQRKLHEQLEHEKSKQLELERMKQFELEKQKQVQLEKKKQFELEQQKQIELQKQIQFELVKQKQLELEKQKKLELEIQKQLELERKKQVELEKQKQLEIERQKQLEKERRRRVEYEKQQRIEHELELEKKRIEEERHKLQQMLLLKEKERKLNEEIQASVLQLVEDLLTKVEINFKEERLKTISNSIRKHKLRFFVKKWRHKIIVRKKKRQAIDQNPIWVPCRTTEEEAHELFTTAQTLALNNIKRYKVGQPTDITLPGIRCTEKIKIPQLYKMLASSYSKHGFRAQTEIFWKLTVSLPDFREFRTGLSYIENILTDFFGWKDRYGTTAVVDKYECFHYAFEKKQGIHSVDGNSNGLLFIMNEITDIGLMRISSSFEMLPNLGKIPIACIIINTDLPRNSDLHKLKNTIEADKRIMNYTVLSCMYADFSITDTIQKSLGFLGRCIEKPPPLELNLLKQFLQVYLATELWKKVSTYSTWNAKYKMCVKLPNVVIGLYNKAVEKLEEIIMDDSCLGYQDFCDDFELTIQIPDVLPCNYRYFPPFWKSHSYRQLLLTNMNSLKLPKFQENWPPETLADLEESLINYLSVVFVDSSTIFYKVLAIFLRNIDPLNNVCDITKASWVDVLELVALEKIQELDFSLRHTEFHTKSVFQELIVVYDISKLDAYNFDEWFYLKNSIVQAEVENQMRTKNMTKKNQQHDSFTFDFDLDELEKSLRDKSSDDSLKKDKFKSAVQELGTLMDDLEESMKIHKSVCSHFQTALTNVLSVPKKN